ncbi:hypothetical protein GH714_034941 [Hevea brasiliensis]|uniref:RNase H type-1 domain-containing protein n=1 Tax=Hevea brasiliensis TaxID=3981 RepID=A0A6A6L399_HEVBR|nr:hypothetical protein GH714_034941 [Hevea brasiliensis]
MDRMNDPNSYANNSGLCGMQIKVSCEKVPSKPNLKEENPKNSKSWETWFSWEMAVIGYPSAFLSTILAMYVIGYFKVAPQPSKRRRNLVRHGLFVRADKVSGFATPNINSSDSKWTCPQSGTLKCNIDVAVFDDRQSTGFGFVLRDENGMFVITGSGWHPGLRPLKFAEAIVVVECSTIL